MRLLDLEVLGKAIGYVPAPPINNESTAYAQLLDNWADLAYRRKKHDILPTEERRKLETGYLTTIYDTKEQRITAFLQLRYDLGDASLKQTRDLLERKLDSILNAENLKRRWEEKAPLPQDKVDRIVTYLDNLIFGIGKLPEPYVAGRYKPSLYK